MSAEDRDETAAQQDAAAAGTTAGGDATHEPIGDRADTDSADPLASLQRTVSTDDESEGLMGGPALVPRSAQTSSGDVADWATSMPEERRSDLVPPVIRADT